MLDAALLLKFFQCPATFVNEADKNDWTLFLQQAREQGLTAKFYYELQLQKLLEQVPLKVKRHGESGARYAQKQLNSLYFELSQLEGLFSQLDLPCILLKGAAYRALSLPMSFGRLFSDIDLLVPHSELGLVRDKLFFLGFHEGQLTEYDRHYYLKWSHQNPPLQHYRRGTTIDLHHHIFPTAAAKRINIAPLFTHAQPVAGSAFLIPPVAHLFIHAAVHLFYQEETHKLVKDIIDLNGLLLEVERQQQLQLLVEQAGQMGVQSAVGNACSVLKVLFNNKAATNILTSSTTLSAQPLVCKLMLTMLTRRGVSASLAQQLWYCRGYSLKMRWNILLYHVVAKPAAAARSWFNRLTHQHGN